MTTNRIMSQRSLHCEQCEQDILLEETMFGYLIVHCPNCTGDCLVYDCYLVRNCLSKAEQALVRHPVDTGQEP